MDPAQIDELDRHPGRAFNLRDVRWHGGRWTRIAFSRTRGFYRKPIDLEAVWRSARRCGCTLTYDSFEFELIALAQKKRAEAEATALTRLNEQPRGNHSASQEQDHGT